MVKHYNILPGYNTGVLRLYFKMLRILLEKGNSYAEEEKQIDYADMLYIPHIWELESKDKYDFLFIDECQDLSAAQLFIAKKLVAYDGRVIAVGDPYQAINGFAGADTDSFNRVADTFKAKKLPLTKCFRCPDDVIKKAKEINSNITENEIGGFVQEIKYCNVVKMTKPGDLIIARNKKQIISIVSLFINKNKRINVRAELANEILPELMKRHSCGEIAIRKAITAQGNTIKIMTIHGAKGLENDRVFIIGYNNLPVNDDNMQDWEKEQEKNILYVALTRAKRELFLVSE
jgi:superfamily I DNA/RNA helicase